MTLNSYFEPSPFRDYITIEPTTAQAGQGISVHRPRFPHETIKARAQAIQERQLSLPMEWRDSVTTVARWAKYPIKWLGCGLSHSR